MNLDQCWSLINMSEKTRKHCFILENCCYDYYEMNALAMAQDGVFGNIIRAEALYIHCLEDFWDAYWKDPNDNDKDNLHWRMKYNMENRGDVYPTHGLVLWLSVLTSTVATASLHWLLWIQNLS